MVCQIIITISFRKWRCGGQSPRHNDPTILLISYLYNGKGHLVQKKTCPLYFFNFSIRMAIITNQATFFPVPNKLNALTWIKVTMLTPQYWPKEIQRGQIDWKNFTSKPAELKVDIAFYDENVFQGTLFDFRKSKLILSYLLCILHECIGSS